MLSERFGWYILEEQIGSGSMGVVFRAIDTRTGNRRVALKLLPPGISHDLEYRKRFIREAERASDLNSPHVVAIHSAGEIEDRLYIDMPLLNGIDLEAYLRLRGEIDTAEALRIVTEVAEALDDAHASNLVHRDIKPSNIFVHTSGFIYIIDFGIAYLDGETYTSSGLGTAEYMAPERYENVSSPKVDVYSLTCVLYQLVVGETPFSGNLLQQFKAHNFSDPPRPSEKNSALPKSFDDVIAKGMAKNPEQRYKSAGDLAAAGKIALKQKTSKPGTTRKPRLSPRRWIKRVALASLIVMLGIATWFFSRPPSVEVVNVGASFEGQFELTGTKVARGGERPSSPYSYSSTWQVRSHCPASNGPCVASIRGTDNPTALESYRYLADFDRGQWSIVFRNANDADGCGEGLPATVWTEIKLKPSSDTKKLTGFTNVYYDGNCHFSERFTAEVNRTGDVDPTIPFEALENVAPEDFDAPGYALDGTYSWDETPVSNSYGNYLPEPSSGTIRVRAICLRDSDSCVSFGTYSESKDISVAWEYNAGTWLATGGYGSQCYEETPEPTMRVTYTNPMKKTAGSGSKATSLTSQITRIVGDPCAATIVSNYNLTRTAD